MALSTLHNVRFAGMASCVPKRLVSNLEDCPPSQRSERERLVRNIGIQTRRLCSEWQCFSDLALAAAEKLLEDLQWQREEIDAFGQLLAQYSFSTPPKVRDRKSTRLNSSHLVISYAVFCLKKKNIKSDMTC